MTINQIMQDKRFAKKAEEIKDKCIMVYHGRSGLGQPYDQFDTNTNQYAEGTYYKRYRHFVVVVTDEEKWPKNSHVVDESYYRGYLGIASCNVKDQYIRHLGYEIAMRHALGKAAGSNGRTGEPHIWIPKSLGTSHKNIAINIRDQIDTSLLSHPITYLDEILDEKGYFKPKERLSSEYLSMINILGANAGY